MIIWYHMILWKWRWWCGLFFFLSYFMKMECPSVTRLSSCPVAVSFILFAPSYWCLAATSPSLSLRTTPMGKPQMAKKSFSHMETLFCLFCLYYYFAEIPVQSCSVSVLKLIDHVLKLLFLEVYLSICHPLSKNI